jgi:hypothetical protein
MVAPLTASSSKQFPGSLRAVPQSVSHGPSLAYTLDYIGFNQQADIFLHGPFAPIW